MASQGICGRHLEAQVFCMQCAAEMKVEAKARGVSAAEQENSRLRDIGASSARAHLEVSKENARLRAEVEAAAIHRRVHMETIRGMNETCNELRAQLAAVTDNLAVANKVIERLRVDNDRISQYAAAMRGGLK